MTQLKQMTKYDYKQMIEYRLKMQPLAKSHANHGEDNANDIMSSAEVLEDMLSEIIWETKRFARDLSTDWWQRKHQLGKDMADHKSLKIAHHSLRELQIFMESASNFLIDNPKYQKFKDDKDDKAAKARSLLLQQKEGHILNEQDNKGVGTETSSQGADLASVIKGRPAVTDVEATAEWKLLQEAKETREEFELFMQHHTENIQTSSCGTQTGSDLAETAGPESKAPLDETDMLAFLSKMKLRTRKNRRLSAFVQQTEKNLLDSADDSEANLLKQKEQDKLAKQAKRQALLAGSPATQLTLSKGIRQLIEQIICSGYSLKTLALPAIRTLIDEIYFEKIDHDDKGSATSLSEFLFHYMFRKYGLRRLAGQRLIDFCASLMSWRKKCRRVELFVKFCGLGQSSLGGGQTNEDETKQDAPAPLLQLSGMGNDFKEAADYVVGTIQGSRAELDFFLQVMKLLKCKRNGKAITSQQQNLDDGNDPHAEATRLVVQTMDAISCAKVAGAEALSLCSPILVSIAKLDPGTLLTSLASNIQNLGEGHDAFLRRQLSPPKAPAPAGLLSYKEEAENQDAIAVDNVVGLNVAVSTPLLPLTTQIKKTGSLRKNSSVTMDLSTRRNTVTAIKGPNTKTRQKSVMATSKLSHSVLHEVLVLCLGFYVHLEKTMNDASQELFRQSDANGDGVLDLSEFTDLVQKIHPKIQCSTIQELFVNAVCDQSESKESGEALGQSDDLGGATSLFAILLSLPTLTPSFQHVICGI
jgi:hypothetical protein